MKLNLELTYMDRVSRLTWHSVMLCSNASDLLDIWVDPLLYFFSVTVIFNVIGPWDAR